LDIIPFLSFLSSDSSLCFRINSIEQHKMGFIITNNRRTNKNNTKYQRRDEQRQQQRTSFPRYKLRMIVQSLLIVLYLGLEESSSNIQIHKKNMVESKQDDTTATPALHTKQIIIQEKKESESMDADLPLMLHPVASLILKGGHLLILNFGNLAKYHGLGSLLSMLARISIFFEQEGHNYKVVVIQSELAQYRYNASVGYFGGFVEQPQLVDIINSQHELESIYDQVR